jgi:hypothetical protein
MPAARTNHLGEFEMRKLLASLLLLADTTFASAQSPPYTFPITLSTSSVQILPVNPLRKRVIFVNPNATALVAVCPLGPARNTGVVITAVVNGAGCVTVLPYSSFTLGSRLIKSTTRGLRRGRQRPNNFAPACRNGWRYV